MPQSPTAAIVIIGNEILSGRTQDSNTKWLAERLTEMGIRLMEVRVVPDIEAMIIEGVDQCRRAYDIVFTTGGIGPTHDDITSATIARLFGVPLILNADAKARLDTHYGDKLNEARLKMAYVPEGATLIDNPVSAAPGFMLENVYVMAGIPSIMQAMFDSIKHTLKNGERLLSETITAAVTEGMIATELTALQKQHPEVDIGSYPFIKHGKLGVSLVLRSTDEAKLEQAAEAVRGMVGQISPSL